MKKQLVSLVLLLSSAGLLACGNHVHEHVNLDADIQCREILEFILAQQDTSVDDLFSQRDIILGMGVLTDKCKEVLDLLEKQISEHTRRKNEGNM